MRIVPRPGPAAGLVEEAVEEAHEYLDSGFRAVKMKIGLGDLRKDIARLLRELSSMQYRPGATQAASELQATAARMSSAA